MAMGFGQYCGWYMVCFGSSIFASGCRVIHICSKGVEYCVWAEEGRSFNCGYVFTLYSLIIEIFENKNTYVYILMRGTPSSFLCFGLVGIGCQEDVVVERIAAGTPTNDECSILSSAPVNPYISFYL